MRLIIATTAAAMLASCGSPAEEDDRNGVADQNDVVVNAPGREEALPPSDEDSANVPPADAERLAPEEVAETPEARAAVAVAERFAQLVEQRRFDAARRLYADGGAVSGLTGAQFAARFEEFETIDVAIGSPPRIEGAAGSLYAEVPLTMTGKLTGGAAYSRSGTVTLRRSNNVPGASEEQLQWRIVKVHFEAG